MIASPLPRILVLKAGTTDPAVVAGHGDYDDWFVATFEDGRARCDVVAAYQDQTLPRPDAYGGVVITGSPASVRDEAAWMDSVARWALAASDAGVPVLGVCFGHQLLGEALGGRVEPNPNGGEYGTIDVFLTEAGRADPLFAGLGTALRVQATHRDALVTAPTDHGVVRLAGNANSTWQAFAAGPNLRAVQFHPELPHAALRDLLARRGQSAPVEPVTDGPRILESWDKRWVRRRAAT